MDLVFYYILVTKLTYTYWQNDGDTQGENLPELEAMLKNLYEDISSGELQGIKQIGILEYETTEID